jgi:hypothetical protein
LQGGMVAWLATASRRLLRLGVHTSMWRFIVNG